MARPSRSLMLLAVLTLPACGRSQRLSAQLSAQAVQGLSAADTAIMVSSARRLFAAGRDNNSTAVRALSVGDRPLAWVRSMRKYAPPFFDAIDGLEVIDVGSPAGAQSTVLALHLRYREFEGLCRGVRTDEVNVSFVRVGGNWFIEDVWLTIC